MLPPKKKKDMFGKTKLFLVVASMLCIASCDTIREDLPRCELWLEFTFDYNMEYADAFTRRSNRWMYSCSAAMTNYSFPKEPRLPH